MVNRQREGAELRRTDREEGLKLLYGAALDVARQEGKIQEESQPSFENSKLERGRFKLRDVDDRLLAAVTLHDARAMLSFRRDLARTLLDHAHVSVNSDNPENVEKRQLRIQKPHVRAMAWAVSTGRRIPLQAKRPLEPLVSAVLLLCCLVPGVVYILRGQQRRRQYADDVEALVHRWRMAGKPDPADSFFKLYHL